MTNRIVAVGLLTSRDLEVLGKGFTRHFAVPEVNAFDDLLRQLDRIDFEPLTHSLVLSTPDAAEN